MLDRLRQGLRHVMGQSAGTARGTEGPKLLESSEARLLIREVDGILEFVPTFSGDPMLRLRGRLCGALSTGRLGSRATASLLRLELPVHVDGRDASIEITVMRPASNDTSDGFVLARARRRRIPPDLQAVELLYSNSLEAQVRYLVQMDAAFKPLGFHEFSRHESVFNEVPSVSQMVAFLRATLHQRRTTLRSLTSMARNAAAGHVHDLVARLNARLSQGQDFSSDLVRETLDWVSQQGRPTNANTLTALALLSDIYLENVGSSHLDLLVEEGQSLPITPAGLAASIAFLGVVKIDPSAGRDWLRPLPPFLQPCAPESVERALHFLQTTVARRNALSILTDLADDSGSERSRCRVEQLLARVGQDQNLLNDEHIALQAYLRARGRPIQPETISALAIYVDFEAGILNEEDVDGLTPQRAFVDASLYSMLAIARAFDVELRCWLLPLVRSRDAGDRDGMWAELENMVDQGEGGVIARFLEPGQPGHQTMYVGSRSDVPSFRERGYIFTGEFLADLPTLHHLSEADLASFEAVGRPVIARFGSEGGVIQWRRLEGSEPAERAALRGLLKTRYSFIDRYEVFHFGQAVLGSRVPVDADQLRGAENTLLVYRDARGAAHFKHMARIERVEEATTPPQGDWEWDGTVVEFPDAALFPRVLTEASHEYLLGLPDERASLSRLDLVYAGLEECLSVPHPSVRLKDAPQLHERVRQTLQSAVLRALLVGIFDAPARDEAMSLFDAQQDELWLSRGLADALDSPAALELAALLVLRTLCLDSTVKYNRPALDDLLLDRMLAATESEDLEARRQAIELIGSDVVASQPEQRLAFSYVLCRYMESDSQRVARAASLALAALALRSVQAPPSLVSRQAPSRPPASADGPAVECLSDQITALFSLPPEQHKLVQTMLMALLPQH